MINDDMFNTRLLCIYIYVFFLVRMYIFHRARLRKMTHQQLEDSRLMYECSLPMCNRFSNIYMS